MKVTIITRTQYPHDSSHVKVSNWAIAEPVFDNLWSSLTLSPNKLTKPSTNPISHKTIRTAIATIAGQNNEIITLCIFMN